MTLALDLTRRTEVVVMAKHYLLRILDYEASGLNVAFADDLIIFQAWKDYSFHM